MSATIEAPERMRRFGGLQQHWRLWRPVAMLILSLLLGLTAWHGGAMLLGNPYLFPTPYAVWTAAVPMTLSGELLQHIDMSLRRVLIGFALGTSIGATIGVIMGRARLIRELLDPIVEALRYLSPTAMIPIAVIWFGIGESSKIFLIFWGTLFFVFINTMAGTMQVPVARERAARCFGATRFQVFRLVILPSVVPHIFVSMRLAMAASFMAIIPAEMLAADSGLGYLLQSSGILLQTDRMFVALAAISLLGLASDRLLRAICDKFLGRYLA